MIRYTFAGPVRHMGMIHLLDVDGTVCFDSQYNCFFALFIPNRSFLETLLSISQLCALSLVTNQSGIAKGLYTINEYMSYIGKICMFLYIEFGINISYAYICPHNAHDSCECRKPKSLMIHEAVRDLSTDAIVTYVYFWGNAHTDRIAFENSGMVGLYQSICYCIDE